MKYSLKLSKQFKKDIKALKKSAYDLTALEELVSLLQNGRLDNDNAEKYNDHPLTGDKSGIRECHLQGPQSNWLLEYQFIDDNLVLLLLRTGTHQKLFRK